MDKIEEKIKRDVEDSNNFAIKEITHSTIKLAYPSWMAEDWKSHFELIIKAMEESGVKFKSIEKIEIDPDSVIIHTVHVFEKKDGKFVVIL